ncbi:MAG: restriction endonuclease subunit S [Desulfobacteraceae bacterium]|nr:restriction endonuclease subunit S [Desulfobacteraceae bacterium]
MMMGTLADIARDNGFLTDGDWVESKDQDTNGDVALIQLADIKDGYFKRKSSRRLTSGKAEKLNCTFLKKGDVLIARMPDPLGRCCIYTAEERKAVTVVDVCIARTNHEKHNSMWLVYSINSPQFRNEINKLQSGTTRKRISKKNLALIQFPILPKKEQDLTVEVIETQFTRLDAAIKSLRAIKNKIEFYRQSVLKAVFEGRSIKKLGELSSLITKGASPRWQGIAYTNAENGVLFVTSENVRSGYIDISKPKYVEKKFNDKQKRSILQNGDVLLNIVGASIGRASIFNEDKLANINQAVALIRIPNVKYRKYICYFLNSNFARAYYAKQKVDVARANLSLKDVYNVPLPSCSDSEMEKIIDEIEARFSVVDKVAEVVDTSLRKSERLRRSILKSAFEGKLVR